MFKQKQDKRVANDPHLEEQWAENAVKYSEKLEELILAAEPAQLPSFRFTPNDDKLYNRFLREFSGLRVDVLDVNELKSQREKLRWYNFLQQNKHLSPEDYNMGTLIRIDSQQKFGPQNSTIVPRL